MFIGILDVFYGVKILIFYQFFRLSGCLSSIVNLHDIFIHELF